MKNEYVSMMYRPREYCIGVHFRTVCTQRRTPWGDPRPPLNEKWFILERQKGQLPPGPATGSHYFGVDSALQTHQTQGEYEKVGNDVYIVNRNKLSALQTYQTLWYRIKGIMYVYCYTKHELGSHGSKYT